MYNDHQRVQNFDTNVGGSVPDWSAVHDPKKESN